MTGGDQKQPLWARSLADQPRPDYDDVIVRVLEEEPEEAPPPRPSEPKPARRRRPLILVLGVIGFVALVLAVEGRGNLTIDDVPSYWGDVPMTCHTIRAERGEGAVEWFWCRAVGGRRLPPGLYRSPESQWTSDLTRVPAKESRIRISPEGEVSGSATY